MRPDPQPSRHPPPAPAVRRLSGPTLDVVARWRHDPTADVPRRARHALTAQLRGWGLSGVDEDDLLLVLTELVSNAVEHARTPFTVTIALDCSAGARVLRIEVADGSTAPPRPLAFDRVAGRGRGLQVIEALATRWGHGATVTGKIVWAEFGC